MSSEAAEYYPGSKQKIQRVVEPQKKQVNLDRWDAKPRLLTVKGEEMEFFTVGDLAKALGRRPVTIRAWENNGLIPKATYRKPSDDPRGQRRLYSRAQVEGLIRIAEEEGLLRTRPRHISKTAFTSRALALFKELALQ